MIMTFIVLTAYLVVGVFYYSFTEEDPKKVANPINWIFGMTTWFFVMWRT